MLAVGRAVQDLVGGEGVAGGAVEEGRGADLEDGAGRGEGPGGGGGGGGEGEEGVGCGGRGKGKGRRRREKGRIVVRGGLRSEGYASLSTGLGEPSSPPDARNNEVSDISELDRRTDHRIHMH